MGKTNRARYTLEFKLEAVRLIGAGQSIAATAAILGLPDQTLHNWLKAHREGRLGGPGAKPVTPEQMELARSRVKLARTKMELGIVKKAAAVKGRLHFRVLARKTSGYGIPAACRTQWSAQYPRQ
jgi:transposase